MITGLTPNTTKAKEKIIPQIIRNPCHPWVSPKLTEHEEVPCLVNSATKPLLPSKLKKPSRINELLYFFTNTLDAFPHNVM